MKDNNEWNEKDAVWDLIGKAAPKEASGKFANDTLRAVKLLPAAASWWPNVLRFAPLAAVAACGVFAAFVFLSPPEETKSSGSPFVSVTTSEEQWVEIEEVADEELLVAAADHLDRFSDQELVSLIGF